MLRCFVFFYNFIFNLIFKLKLMIKQSIKIFQRELVFFAQYFQAWVCFSGLTFILCFTIVGILLLVSAFFSGYCYPFDKILHVKDDFWDFEVYHLTLGGESLRVLCLCIWKQVHTQNSACQIIFLSI